MLNRSGFPMIFASEPVGKLATMAFKEQSGALMAYMNHKGIRGGLSEGPIRRNELLLILPWNNRIHTFTSPPPNKIHRQSLQHWINSFVAPPNPIRGRGPGSNYHSGKPDVESVVDGLLDRPEPDEPVAVVAMPEFLTRMTESLTTIDIHGEQIQLNPLTGREMLKRYIEKHSPITSPTPGH